MGAKKKQNKSANNNNNNTKSSLKTHTQRKASEKNKSTSTMWRCDFPLTLQRNHTKRLSLLSLFLRESDGFELRMGAVQGQNDKQKCATLLCTPLTVVVAGVRLEGAQRLHLRVAALVAARETCDLLRHVNHLACSGRGER